MLTIIKIEANEQGRHDIQSQSHRTACWEDGYLEVPAHLEAKVWESLGWCDLVIDEETGALTDIIPTEKPEPPEPEPSELDKLQEQVDGLEEDKADKTDVQAVWDSMAAAYSEGVQSA